LPISLLGKKRHQRVTLLVVNHPNRFSLHFQFVDHARIGQRLDPFGGLGLDGPGNAFDVGDRLLKDALAGG
jgi:hypothetical protein